MRRRAVVEFQPPVKLCPVFTCHSIDSSNKLHKQQCHSKLGVYVVRYKYE